MSMTVDTMMQTPVKVKRVTLIRSVSYKRQLVRSFPFTPHIVQCLSAKEKCNKLVWFCAKLSTNLDLSVFALVLLLGF